MLAWAFRPAALALLLCACRAEAEPPVATVPAGPIADEADMIPAADEERLDAKLRQFLVDQRTAIVVNTVVSLQDRSIEDEATDRFNTWGIGHPDTHQGVLILIARDNRQARIEVGCALETVLTDAVAGEIMEGDLIPFFLVGNFPEGINAAVDSIGEALATATVEPGPASPICLANAA